MIDPWAKAAECTRALALNFTLNPERKMVLLQLREFWITLANERAMGKTGWESLAESASGIHADAMASVH